MRKKGKRGEREEGWNDHNRVAGALRAEALLKTKSIYSWQFGALCFMCCEYATCPSEVEKGKTGERLRELLRQVLRMASLEEKRKKVKGL